MAEPVGEIGARSPRNEDRRHLRGAGRFLADLRLDGARELHFVRSPVAHGRIRAIEPPEGLGPHEFWTAADLAGRTKPIRAVGAAEGFQASDYTLLATDRVRFVGEPVAMVVADDRAHAEDLEGEVVLDIEPLEAVADPRAALREGAPLLHDGWSDNRFVSIAADNGDVDAAAAAAAVSVTRELDMARHAGVPLETRGCLAYHDSQVDQLVLYSSTQFPHVIRTILADLLKIEERRLRVIAPDVGGGFGVKNNIYPEEVATCAVALQVGHPVRWIEDRWENLVAAAQAREHRYRVTLHASAEGDILGLDAEILVDAGAYSVWPWTAGMEAGMAAGNLPGPYHIRDYRFRATTAATNKVPLGPYRGVARPGACFAIERMIDETARELGIEAKDMRERNMVRPNQMPYTTVTGLVFDSGDYAESVRTAAETAGHDAVRARQRTERDGSRIRTGIGYASFAEQTAHGAQEWMRRGLPVIFGFESATVAIDPSGGVTVRVGIQSHGQGMETTLAQIAGSALGVPSGAIGVRHGDTDISPYGMGTFGSRSMVMAGGATHHAATELAGKVRRIAAVLLGCEAADVVLADQKAAGPSGEVSLAEIADACYLHVGRLPLEIEPALEVTHRYRPVPETGTFSYATHAAVVRVDLDSGEVEIADYVVVEDCGRVINPMIVDGQVAGGVAQGIGTALLEESVYDEDGQPKATTFLDYLLPGATEVPKMRIVHSETLSPHTALGIKGVGESGAIAPPAAIANAISDACADLGVSICSTPITPAKVWLAVQAAGAAREATA